MIRAALAVYFTALSLWIGGLAALSFVVAPAVFRTAPSRPVAGAIFGTVLRTFVWVEIGCAVLVAGSAALLQSQAGGTARLVLIGLMIALLLAHAFGVAPAVAAERTRVQGFDTLPDGDPQKARFDSLHRWSVRLVGSTILLGLALIVLSASALGRPKPA